MFYHKRGEYTPPSDYQPLPDGTYEVVIEDSKLIDNKQGTGKIIKIQYCVLNGEHEHRKIFDNLNTINESQLAQTIATNALNGILAAINKDEMHNAAELINNQLSIQIKNYKSKKTGEDRQSFKYIKQSLSEESQISANNNSVSVNSFSDSFDEDPFK